MPVYDYLCPICNHRWEEVFSIHDDSTYALCPNWNNSIHRDTLRLWLSTPGHLAAAPREPDYGHKIVTQFPGITHGMVKETHYNASVGKVITNDVDFKSELSRQSDEASERNQFAVNFQPIDHRDAGQELGVTEEGMDSTYARRKHVESH